MPQPATKITAQKNGASWSPVYGKGVLSDLDSLSISATSVSYEPSALNKIDTLNITIRYRDPGTYQLKGNQAFYGMFNNDALTGYQLDESYNNVVNITSYQRINGDVPNGPYYAKVTGTFSLKFIDPNNPAGIIFQNGSFYSMIINQ